MTSKTSTAPTNLQLAAATSWVPENTGDSITGTVLGFDIYENDEYGKSPVVILDSAEVDAATVASDASNRVRRVYVLGVLFSQFKEMDLTVGDTYTVISLGTAKSRNRTTKSGDPVEYNNYASYKGDAPTFSTTLDMSLFD